MSIASSKKPPATIAEWLTRPIGQKTNEPRLETADTKRRGPKPYVLQDCAAPECGRKTTRLPYCDRCRLRAKRHGDVAMVLKRGRKAK